MPPFQLSKVIENKFINHYKVTQPNSCPKENFFCAFGFVLFVIGEGELS
jgi:hypothetical protein